MFQLKLAVLLLLSCIVAQGNDTCPVCFDCTKIACTNYGVCNNGICSCPDGFGTQDCSKPVCGSLAQFALNRPLMPDAGCQCTDSFEGPNCNVCSNDQACSFLPQSTLGQSIICNKSPVVYASRHFSYCSVSSALLSAAYSGEPARATVQRDIKNKTILATQTPQFTCTASKCVQTFQGNMTSWSCSDVNCVCQRGTKMCGGGPVDISSVVNSARQSMSVICSDSETCQLNLEFLRGLFPSGIDLRQCSHGECVDKFAIPQNDELNKSKDIDIYGIVAFSILGFLIVLLISVFVWGFIDRSKKRALPIPKGLPGMSISFSNISYSIKDKQILSDLNGTVNSGELLAILGPSGGGKTTFLDILARKRKGGTIKGTVDINGAPVFDERAFRYLSGYVDQEDVHIPTLTVREVLEFSATLRLPEAMSTKEKGARVDIVLDQLGLTHVANSRVGDSLRRGISGGEKRRLSIGVELVTNPSIILDEPTSGLDSYNALQVMQTLSSLAKEHKKTVIFTVHQPNSSIFALFDLVMLLSKGRLVYYGVSSQASAFCAEKGSPCPPQYHIADHLLDYASGVVPTLPVTSQGDVNIEGLRHRRMKTPETQGLLQSDSLTSFVTDPNADLLGASFITQITHVLKRAGKVFWRSPVLFWSHVGLSVVIGVFIGMLYYQVDNTLGGIQNRLGSIFFMQALLAFAGLSAIATLASDKVLFIRERSNGFYGYFPYFFSKVVFDIVPLRILPAVTLCSIAYFLIGFDKNAFSFFKFLVIMILFSVNSGLHGFAIACLIPETSTSTLAAAMSILFQMLFAGILINQVQIPIGLRWIQYLSFFKYAYEACIANEASGLTLVDQISGVGVTIPAGAVLTNFGLDVDAYYKDLVVTIGLFAAFLIIIAILINVKLRERR